MSVTPATRLHLFTVGSLVVIGSPDGLIEQFDDYRYIRLVGLTDKVGAWNAAKTDHTQELPMTDADVEQLIGSSLRHACIKAYDWLRGHAETVVVTDKFVVIKLDNANNTEIAAADWLFAFTFGRRAGDHGDVVVEVGPDLSIEFISRGLEHIGPVACLPAGEDLSRRYMLPVLAEPFA